MTWDRHKRRQPVALEGMTTGAFGQLVQNPLTVEISAYTKTCNDTRVWNIFTQSGGTVTELDSGQAQLSTGTTVGAYAALLSVNVMPYHPGAGMRYLWTARYSTGIALSTQLAGPFNAEAGFAFGYNGADFGILHRYGRRVEIQSYELTAAAGGAETATVTLNGTGHAVSLTGAGTVQADARELAEHGAGYADATASYEAWQLDDTVYFVRKASGDATGTFSYASTGTSAATITEEQQGADGTSDWTVQADWSMDDCPDLDPTQGNIYGITWGWLGYLGPTFWVADPQTQAMKPVHFIPWSGTDSADDPTVADPRFPVAYSVASLGSTTDLSVWGASVFGGLEGNGSPQGPRFGLSARNASVGTTEVPILSIMTAPVDTRRSAVNRRRLNIHRIRVGNAGSKDLEIDVYIGDPSNLTGYNFQQDDTDSAIWYDTSATAVTGTMDLIDVMPVEAGQSELLRFDTEHLLKLQRGQVLILTAKTAASTSDALVSVTGWEDP